MPSSCSVYHQTTAPPPRGSPLLPRSDHQQTHHEGDFRDTTMDLMNGMVRAQITLRVAGMNEPNFGLRQFRPAVFIN